VLSAFARKVLAMSVAERRGVIGAGTISPQLVGHRSGKRRVKTFEKKRRYDGKVKV
jgi:hypothetical protein